MLSPRPDPPINASLDALPDPWTPPATDSRSVVSRAVWSRAVSESSDSLTEDSPTPDASFDGEEDPLGAARGILVGFTLSFLLGALAVVLAWWWR